MGGDRFQDGDVIYFLSDFDLWAGVTELFLRENLPLKDALAGIIEFFAEHIPHYLHSYVLARLSADARYKLFSTLAVLAI